jgi:hypothetical protein
MTESSIKAALSNYSVYAQNDLVRDRIERDLIALFGDEVIRSVDFVADKISVEYHDGVGVKIALYP